MPGHKMQNDEKKRTERKTKSKTKDKEIKVEAKVLCKLIEPIQQMSAKQVPLCMNRK